MREKIQKKKSIQRPKEKKITYSVCIIKERENFFFFFPLSFLSLLFPNTFSFVSLIVCETNNSRNKKKN